MAEKTRKKMKRVVIVYNPRSTQAGRIEREIIEPARKMKGYVVGKYAVQEKDVTTNAKNLAKILLDDDIVVATGGDGTATMVVNGVMRAKKQVSVAVLPYGNFNDTAEVFGVKNLKQAVSGKVTEVCLLEVSVNKKHWRYVVNYVTVGLLAESVKVFENKKMRQRLQKKEKNLVYSLWNLFLWWLENRDRRFLPEFKLNGRKVAKGTTDYLAVNGKRVAKIMKTKDSYKKEGSFRGGVVNLSGFWKMTMFMIKSMNGKMAVTETDQDKIEFYKPARVCIQAEGEYEQMEGVEEIEVKKAKQKIMMVKI